MMFNYKIDSLSSWGEVFQSVDAFKPMIEFIFRKHKLEFTGIENCTPGSNAVFKVGAYIVKIFAPKESTIGGEDDYYTELFGLRRANDLKVATPKLYAYGIIEDKYRFPYLVMEHVKGESLNNKISSLTREEKRNVGAQLRGFVENLDVECEKFNSHVLLSSAAEERWKSMNPEFQKERKNYISNISDFHNVYIHGDLNEDNIIIKEDNDIRVIDYADGYIAPIEVEYACLIFDGFHFDKDCLSGFFGDYNSCDLAETCIKGLMLHDYGYNLIRDNIMEWKEISGISQLKDIILKKI